MELTDKQITELVARRHPLYESMKDHWEFLDATYRGGREWFNKNIFRYFKEGEAEYKERIERAYRFNHTREVVNLVHKYIFKESVVRAEDASDCIKRFWKSATRDRLSIDDFMRTVDISSSVFGRIWIVVDSTKSGDVVTIADEKQYDSRVYAYIVTPQQMLDFAYDEDGELSWCLIAETGRDDADPLESTGKTFLRYRLWTKKCWYLMAEVPTKNKNARMKVELKGYGTHDLGVVPVFPVDCFNSSDNKYTSPALIDDIAYLDRSVANYLSNLDAIIQDQTYSQLAIPVQGLLPGDDDHNKVLDMGTKRVFTFNGEGGAKPFFMSPDPKQAQIIIETISKIINEIYHSVGVAGERTKQDNAVGIDNSSGVAKAFDFQRVNSLLVNKASTLQRAEHRLAAMVSRWYGNNRDQLEIDCVSYPESFDIRGLADEFAVAEQLQKLQVPDAARREQMEMLLKKVFPRLTEAKSREIFAELKNFPAKNDHLSVVNKSPLTYTSPNKAQGTEPTDSQDTE